MQMLPKEVELYISQILAQAKNGIVISDPNQEDNPLIYVNQSFIDLFGYEYDEVIGKNCRYLQGEDREQKGIQKIRDAMKEQKPITTILRNYTKSGRLIYNEATISPIFDKDSGKIKYFLGIQKDVTKEQELLNQIKGLV